MDGPWRLANSALASILRANPEALAALGDVAPCRLALRVDGLDVAALLEFRQDGVSLERWLDGMPVDVEVRGPPATLVRAAATPGDDGHLLEGRLRVHGDAAKLQALRRWFGLVDFDWEEWLALRTGDVAAHQLGNAARGMRAWLGALGNDASADLGEYLLHEARLVVGAEELRVFGFGVETLRDDTERLEQRLQRLARTMDSSEGGPPPPDPGPAP